MTKLVKDNGKIDFGIYSEPVDEINYRDYSLKSAMGASVNNILKKILPNQFVFFGVMGPDIMLGTAVVDLKYLANGFFYVFDRKNNKMYESKSLYPSTSNVYIKPYPDNLDAQINAGGVSVAMKGDIIKAKGDLVSLDVKLDLADTAPLRLCTRSGYRGWIYTQKTSPINISGEVEINGKAIDISSPSHMGLIDWTCGYMRRETCWNWAASAASLPDGRSFGLNLSCGINETSFTENAFWVDGRMTKVDTVDFIFDEEDFYKKWIIRSYDKKVDIEFTAENHREENVNAMAVVSRFTQVMGTFSGIITDENNEKIELNSVPGWTEDHFARW